MMNDKAADISEAFKDIIEYDYKFFYMYIRRLFMDYHRAIWRVLANLNNY